MRVITKLLLKVITGSKDISSNSSLWSADCEEMNRHHLRWLQGDYIHRGEPAFIGLMPEREGEAVTLRQLCDYGNVIPEGIETLIYEIGVGTGYEWMNEIQNIMEMHV